MELGEGAGKVWVGLCSKKPENNAKQERKEPPPIIAKESGRVLGDGRERDAGPSPTQAPEVSR